MDIWSGLGKEGLYVILVVGAYFLIVTVYRGYLFTAWVHQAIERHANDFPHKL